MSGILTPEEEIELIRLIESTIKNHSISIYDIFQIIHYYGLAADKGIGLLHTINKSIPNK